MSNPYQTWLSDVFGLIYLFAWSLSFYPQAWENYRRKNLSGFSLEFAFLHPFAYFFYNVYTWTGFLNPYLT